MTPGKVTGPIKMKYWENFKRLKGATVKWVKILKVKVDILVPSCFQCLNTSDLKYSHYVNINVK